MVCYKRTVDITAERSVPQHVVVFVAVLVMFCRRPTRIVGMRPSARRRPRSHVGPTPVLRRLAAAGRSVCRKYRKASIRRLQQQEYDKLCRIVPSLSTRRHRRRISKVTSPYVIE